MRRLALILGTVALLLGALGICTPYRPIDPGINTTPGSIHLRVRTSLPSRTLVATHRRDRNGTIWIERALDGAPTAG
jgi:hypothetical protein